MRYERRLGDRRHGTGGATIALWLAALIVLAFAMRVSAQVATPLTTVTYEPGQGTKLEGGIVARHGDDLIVRQAGTNNVMTVSLTDRTTVETPSGFMNLSRARVDQSTLIRGLFIKVTGTGGDRGNLVADRISFHKSAMRAATAASAGEVNLTAQVQANTDSISDVTARGRDSLASLKDRVENIDNYDAKFTGTVNFATGSAALDADAKRTLDSLVASGTPSPGYLLEVAGYADVTGGAAMNQQLSEERVASVVQYLNGTHAIPLRRIVNPTGFGARLFAAPNDTPEGRAQNRRVVVKVLVNRGLTK